MKKDFKNIKPVLTLRGAYTKRNARLRTFSWRLIGDEKIKYRAFFTSVTFTENKKGK
jgi:hypothetical protein